MIVHPKSAKAIGRDGLEDKQEGNKRQQRYTDQ